MTWHSLAFAAWLPAESPGVFSCSHGLNAGPGNLPARKERLSVSLSSVNGTDVSFTSESSSSDDQREPSAASPPAGLGLNAGRARSGKGSARQRRLEKSSAAREQRQQSAEEEFRQWAQSVARDDPELMEIFGNSLLDPAEMQRKVEERVQARQSELLQPALGRGEPMEVVVARDLDPFELHVWFQLHRPPSEEELDTLGSVLRAWYLVGKIGGYNSTNLQLLSSEEQQDSPSYSMTAAETALPSALHNIGDLEFQGALGRVWMDLGTADMLALDVLINSLTMLSTEHVGIKKVTIGGDKMEGWLDGLTSGDEGYQLYTI